MDTFSLDGPAAEVTAVKVYGLLGTFRVGHSDYRVRYASTYANPVAAEGRGGHRDLLRELKPVRERLEASKLKNLSSLLQRDLNDNRVAHDLIPYLQGEGINSIGFFPAILAVLVPLGYLSENPTTAKYPTPSQSTNNPLKTEYDSCWSVTQYKIGDQSSPLGLLEIVPSRAEVIVLDGQHRANAFRYLSGDFDPSKDIYQTFYDDVAASQPLDADLPVTLIWFETEDGKAIDPQLISRKLFVDVNNTAKSVSLARTILLNDRAATCLGTQELYNRAAQESGFSAGSFSLLHSAFDMDSDIAKRRQHRFMLTTPEIINDALSWAMFSTTTFDDLRYYNVSRVHDRRNITRFRKIFPNLNITPIGSDDDTQSPDSSFGPYFDTQDKAQQFRNAFHTAYLPVLWSFFNDLRLLEPHYEAGKAVVEYVNKEAGPTEVDVWHKVFCGGEGLYWSLDSDKAHGQRWENYQRAIENIEQLFARERGDRFGSDPATTDGVYRSFQTKAFQTGYVGAVDCLARDVTDGDYLLAASNLITRLNDQYKFSNWIAILNELKPLLFPGIDPKFWPLYRNLLLRMYDGQRGELFDAYSVDNIYNSPDGRAYTVYLDRVLSQIKAAYEDQPPPDDEMTRRARVALEGVNELLARCGLTAPWFEFDTVLKYGIQYLKQELSSHYGVSL